MSERIGLALLTVLMAVAAAVLVLPVWAAPILPLLDEPDHLSAILIWSRYGDSNNDFARWYGLHIEPVPYFNHYALAWVFAKVVSPVTAHKLVMSLYVLAFPAAGAWWCVRTQRTPWMAVLVAPLAYNRIWAYGFHAFNVGLATMLLAICALDALLLQPSRGRRLLFGVLCFATYTGHPIPLATLGVATAVLVFVHRPRLDELWKLLAVSAPTIVMFAWQLVRPKEHWSPWGWSAENAPTDTLRLGLQRFPQFAYDVVVGDADADLFQLWIAGIAATALLCFCFPEHYRWRLPGRDPERSREILLRNRGLLIAAALAVAYLVLPDHLVQPSYIWVVRGRLVVPCLFFAFSSLPVRRLSWRAWLVVPAAGGCIFLGALLAQEYADFGRHQLRPLEHLVALVPREGRVVTFDFGSSSPPSSLDYPFGKLPATVQILRGTGYSASLAEKPISFPFYARVAQPTPWPDPAGYVESAHGRLFTHAIVHGGTAAEAHLAPEHWREVSREGEWTLYARLPPGPLPPKLP